MSTETSTADQLSMHNFDKPKLPSGLNILTILTFIGSALMLIGACWQFFTAQKNYDEKDAAIAKMSDPSTPAFVKRMMGTPADYEMMVTKNLENRIPVVIVAIIAALLCIYGAMQMRKLQKQGYLFYIIGELLPFVSMIAFLGAFAMKGTGFYFAIGITALFILLYTLQRKHLVY